MKLFGRHKQHPDLKRQSSDDSCHSSAGLPSSSRTHRRAPSFKFNEWSSMCGPQGPSSDASVKSSRTNATDPLDESWSSSCSGVLSQVDMVMDHRWPPESKGSSDCDGDSVEHKRSSCPLEIIRLLSFSPPRRTKKRADTADTASSSSSSSGMDHEDCARMDLLDLQQLEDLRRGSPSPLLGLQYLPDEFI